eukprot:SAG11_NODE_11259_length_773_cov_1.066766_1_plen_20_part_01
MKRTAVFKALDAFDEWAAVD